MTTRRRIALACDHAGFELKEALKADLATEYDILDLGGPREIPGDDYPDYAEKIGIAVIEKTVERGILICGSGVGAEVSANKIPGVRAGLCHDTYSAHQGVEHDDMNVLALGSRVIGVALAKELARTFLTAAFTNEERHRRRVGKVTALEAKFARRNNEAGGSAP